MNLRLSERFSANNWLRRMSVIRMNRPIKISVHVEEEDWLAFKNYVLSKYGLLRGYLGEELSNAIRKYLKEAQQNQEGIENIISKPNKKHLKLLYWLVEDFPVQVTQIDLENFVIENFGSDKRTKRKYINDFLVRMRFIEVQKAIYGKNIIYKVNLERIIDYLRKFVPKEKIEQLELILKRVKERPKGIVIESDNGNGKEPTSEIKEFAAERYKMGDSLEEIKDKLEDFGVQISKKVIRSIIRDSLKERGGL